MTPATVELAFAGGRFVVDPARYTWPENTPTRCSSCDAPILFVRTEPRRAWIPLDVAEGPEPSTPHFATCPAAATHRRPR